MLDERLDVDIVEPIRCSQVGVGVGTLGQQIGVVRRGVLRYRRLDAFDSKPMRWTVLEIKGCVSGSSADACTCECDLSWHLGQRGIDELLKVDLLVLHIIQRLPRTE
jgi:hypothetical protein